MSDPQSTEPANQNTALRRRRHWLGLPICEPVEGTVDQVLDVLPHFGRQPFTMASPNGDDIGVNPFLDTVYKIASRKGERSIPVGVVSKNYRLVDHHYVLRTVQDVLSDKRDNLAEMLVRGEWTVNGTRLARNWPGSLESWQWRRQRTESKRPEHLGSTVETWDLETGTRLATFTRASDPMFI